jgi:membrane protein DedA with SNARE-associated domain
VRWTILWIALLALILVPFFLFEDWFTVVAARITDHATSRGWAAAVIGALLASDVFLPVPSSLVSAAAGVTLGFWPAMLLIWSSMTLACGLGYGFGRVSAAAARRFVGDAGIARATRLAADYGDYAIVMCRPIPVLAEASVIVAGLVHRPVARFLLLTIWSNLGIAVVYAAIGAFAMRVDSFLLAFLGAIAVPGLAFLASRVWLDRR